MKQRTIITKIVSFDNDNTRLIKQIHTRVFIEEQGVEHNLDFDDQDRAAIHILAYSNNKAIATARMLDDGHIERVAILKSYRMLGVGRKLLLALLELTQTT